MRVPLPPERVDDTQDYEIEEADIRRLHLIPTGTYESVQHSEVPEMPVWVTEHRLAVYRSPAGDLYLPDVPELKGPLFGPRLLTMIGWLKSEVVVARCVPVSMVFAGHDIEYCNDDTPPTT